MMSLVSARIAALTVTVSILQPDPAPHHQRISGLDINRVRWAECEYRGITASFETLSRAYALKAYRDVEFIDWAAWPSPSDPYSEALVACRFSVGSVAPDSPVTDSTMGVRRAAAGHDLEIIWRLNTLYRIHVTEYNGYARDALNVFTRTVDEFHHRLAVVGDPTPLRLAPGDDDPAVDQLEVGTVVLRQHDAGAWTFVEVHGDTLGGWLETDVLTIP